MHMKYSRSLLYNALLLCIFFAAQPLPAVEIVPFQTQNQSPLIQIFGLPGIGKATVLDRQAVDLRFTVDLANNYTTETTAREKILLDGESTRFTLLGRYGLGRGLEVGMEIPYLITGGGFLDNFIEGYHHTFGFPNGGRELAPANRLLYHYEKNGRTLLHVDQSGAGLGDVRLTGGWQLLGGEKNSSQGMALRASLKLPTGDSDGLRGSGSTDLAVWLVGSTDVSLTRGHLSFFGAARCHGG